MFIYPAVDIKEGRCVRLTQGKADQKTEYFTDPVEPARQFQAAGADWIHVVDLDGAFFGSPANLDTIRRIAELGLKVEMGGGIRSVDVLHAVFEAGVSRAIIGTRACQEPEFVRECVGLFGDKIAVGIDAKNGLVAVKGWVEVSDTPAVDLAQKVASYGVKTIIYTDISTDGMMTGPNFEGQKAMLEAVSANIIASGGVAKRDDVARYAEMAKVHANLDGVIIGKAIYEGAVDPADVIAAFQS